MISTLFACLAITVLGLCGALLRIRALKISLLDIQNRLTATVQDVRRLRELGQLVDQAVGIVTFDNEDFSFSANSIFCHVRHLSQEALLGSKIPEIMGFTVKTVLDEIKAKFSQHELWKGELCCQREDGSQFWCYAVFYPQFSVAGVYEGCMALLIDLSENKEAQVTLERTRHLTALGEMAGSIAHEINNPLAVIAVRSEVMIKKLKKDPQDISHIPSGLGKILSTTLRITKIVDAMRRLSRIESGSMEPQVENLALVVDEAVEFIAERAKRHGVTINLERLGINETYRILALGYGLQQILINLLSNALDALEEVIDGSDHWIRITCKQHSIEHLWELRVFNSGPRIPDHVADHLMTPFFTTKPVGKGTGLGLSLSSKIAESHGGRLYLDRKSAFTCFVLEVPISDVSPGEQQSA